MWRVQYFDKQGKLLCWYSTPNKLEAYRFASSGLNRSRNVVIKVSEVCNNETPL